MMRFARLHLVATIISLLFGGCGVRTTVAQSTPSLRPVAYLPIVLAQSPSQPDEYEPDDDCATAKNIVPGSIQTRTLESTSVVTDTDVIRLKFPVAGSYDARVEALGTGASPRVEILLSCPGELFDMFTPAGPVRLVVPSANYTVYLVVRNLLSPTGNRQNTSYRLVIGDRIAATSLANTDSISNSIAAGATTRVLTLPAR